MCIKFFWSPSIWSRYGETGVCADLSFMSFGDRLCRCVSCRTDCECIELSNLLLLLGRDHLPPNHSHRPPKEPPESDHRPPGHHDELSKKDQPPNPYHQAQTSSSNTYDGSNAYIPLVDSYKTYSETPTYSLNPYSSSHDKNYMAKTKSGNKSNGKSSYSSPCPLEETVGSHLFSPLLETRKSLPPHHEPYFVSPVKIFRFIPLTSIIAFVHSGVKIESVDRLIVIVLQEENKYKLRCILMFVCVLFLCCSTQPYVLRLLNSCITTQPSTTTTTTTKGGRDVADYQPQPSWCVPRLLRCNHRYARSHSGY